MTVNEDWVYTEERLKPVAGSMGQILAQIRPWISDRLVGGNGWDRPLERAVETPATMGACPFGFEIPLLDARPVADFGVTLLGGSRPDPGVFLYLVDDVLAGGGDRLRELNAVHEAVVRAGAQAVGRPPLTNAGKWIGSAGRCGRTHRSGPSARSRRGTGRCESR